MSFFCNFWKVPKSNFSETCENEKFGNFCPMQGLIFNDKFLQRKLGIKDEKIETVFDF
jgi:hypothetical protein